MICGIHVEVLLALVYALFLMAAAFLLELLGRKSHKKAEAYRNAGFVYFRELDYFSCPAGRQLVQVETDYQRRIVSYRAPASACNSCALKLNCTDSDEGRLLERRFDRWIESELRKFHRGISLTLLVLATVLLLAEVLRYPGPHDRSALAGLLVLLGFTQLKLLPSPWSRRPAHFGRGQAA